MSIEEVQNQAFFYPRIDPLLIDTPRADERSPFVFTHKAPEFLGAGTTASPSPRECTRLEGGRCASIYDFSIAALRLA